MIGEHCEQQGTFRLLRHLCRDSFGMGRDSSSILLGGNMNRPTMCTCCGASSNCDSEECRIWIVGSAAVYRAAMQKTYRNSRGLSIDPPDMAHGDAERIGSMCTRAGLPLMPWQRDLLERLEAASINKQFNVIIKEHNTFGEQP